MTKTSVRRRKVNDESCIEGAETEAYIICTDRRGSTTQGQCTTRDDMVSFYKSFYSHPNLSVLVNRNMRYMTVDQIKEAMVYASLGDEESLTELIASLKKLNTDC